ncbi:hypothetical protein [Terasakiella sp. SH-1]|uniref:hypothetical protein n=1 Tax=Terasakiella sp. SH-1 TaxID=2560057 RepID=UPI0010743EB8|nr:hypothetical protein [Terasakiella sp. SH-1]
MAISRLTTNVKLLFCGIVTTTMISTAHAQMAVQDNAVLAKTIEGLSTAKEHLDTVNEVRDQIDEQLKRVGKYGKLTLPIFNTLNMANQLKRDAQCLMPDWKQLIPSLNFEEVGFSLCDRSSFYRNNLWVDPAKIGGRPIIDPVTGEIKNPGDLGGDWSTIPGGGTSWGDPSTGWGNFPDKNAQHESIRRYRENLARRQAEVKELRQNIYQDAVTNALAQADKEAADSERRSQDIDDVQQQTADSADQPEQLASIGQSNVQIARMINKQNQILAALLKVQAAYALKAGVPINEIPQIAQQGQEGDGGSQ